MLSQNLHTVTIHNSRFHTMLEICNYCCHATFTMSKLTLSHYTGNLPQLRHAVTQRSHCHSSQLTLSHYIRNVQLLLSHSLHNVTTHIVTLYKSITTLAVTQPFTMSQFMLLHYIRYLPLLPSFEFSRSTSLPFPVDPPLVEAGFPLVGCGCPCCANPGTESGLD